MPELPEVETIKEHLLNVVINKYITTTEVRCQKLRYIIPHNLGEVIGNQLIIDIKRRGKFLLIELKNGYSIIIHLGMSGRLLLRDNNAPTAKHDHVIINLNNQQKLVLNDARRFGMIDIVASSKAQEHIWLSQIGLEPLSPDFNSIYLYEILSNRSTAIKTAIMNSTVVAGIGNIYASEILFKSGIHPLQTCNKLSRLQLENLVSCIKATLLHAIKLGGSSFHSFVNASGNKGNFQNCFLVYNRAELDCTKCDNKIIKIRQSGRATFFCPSCQKL